jgi:hypothetical protein
MPLKWQHMLMTILMVTMQDDRDQVNLELFTLSQV